MKDFKLEIYFFVLLILNGIMKYDYYKYGEFVWSCICGGSKISEWGGDNL